MNKICGIYKIVSPTGKIYIGQSRNIISRKNDYKNSRCKNQVKLYHSILKYGWKAHIFEIICKCQIEELNDLEKYYIEYYNTFNTVHGLNLTSGGNNTILSDETKKKISKSHLNNKYCVGRKLTDETKFKMGNNKRGIKLSPEHVLKVTKKIKGSYEIYNDSNILVYKFNNTFESTMKSYNLPARQFRYSYTTHKKIRMGVYKNWYAIKL